MSLPTFKKHNSYERRGFTTAPSPQAFDALNNPSRCHLTADIVFDVPSHGENCNAQSYKPAALWQGVVPMAVEKENWKRMPIVEILHEAAVRGDVALLEKILEGEGQGLVNSRDDQVCLLVLMSAC